MLGYFIARSFSTLSEGVKNNSKKLIENAETNRGILDTSKDAIVSITTVGDILYCNQTTITMFGYSKDELVGENIRMLMPEPFSRQHDSYLAEHMRTGIKKEIWGGARELVAKKKDGSTLPVFLSIGSVTIDESQIFTGFIRDLTDQKMAQDKLELLNKNLTLQNTKQEHVAKIAEVMQGASDMCLLGDNIISALVEMIGASQGVLYRYDTDTDNTDKGQGMLSFVSAYAYHSISESPPQIRIGQGLLGQCAKSRSIIHTKDIPPGYASITSGVGESSPQELLLLPILFEQKLLGVIELASFSPVSDDQVELVSEISHDIGVVINNVINIEKTNRFLTKMQQQSDELREQSQKLEQSSAYKSDFLATMSHEIRTPMNGVLGMLSMLVKSDLSEDQMKKASMARSSAQSLLAIINDILDFSKVEAGKLELEMLDFDLRALLEEMSELMALKAHEKGIDLNLDVVDIHHSMVKGDASRVRQILTNLIGNAIKFTHSGDITVNAKLEPLNDQGLKFVCSVEDSGIGISADQQEQLFEEFRQADASTTREYGGTGLGLSICKKLCQLMGGDISVSGEKGKGSCFKFTLILEKGAERKPVISPDDGRSIRVLVADHREVSRDIVRRQFEAWGLQVSEVKNAREALSMLGNCSSGQHFHLAFIDTNLADMSIRELLAAVDDSLATRVILTSSIADEPQRQEYTTLGAHKYLRKPVTPSDMFDALVELPEYREKCKYGDGRAAIVTSPDTTEDGNEEWVGNPRILLVEDNFVNQELMTFMMDDIGLVPDIASDGQEALDMLNSSGDRAYSLVLMDCQMPNMDGFTATECIREGKARQEYMSIPIVALTANALNSDRERCMASGMNDYLSKPVDSASFVSVLRKWLA